jgi:hypothetical protein
MVNLGKLFKFWDRASLSWPWTLNLPALASQVLGLKTSTTIPSWEKPFNCMWWLAFCSCDQNTWENTLKEGNNFLAHSFRGFYPLSLGPISLAEHCDVESLWRVACSPHWVKEVEKRQYSKGPARYGPTGHATGDQLSPARLHFYSFQTFPK